jgi:hypothetical protein
MPATYEPIATFTFTGAEVNTTFSSIPQTYTDLRLVVSGSAAGGGNSQAYVNGVATSTSYTAQKLWGNGSTASSTYFTTMSGFVPSNGSARGWTSTPNTIVWEFPNYTQTTNFKPCLFYAIESAATGSYILLYYGLYESNSAITSITCGNLSNTMDAGTIATLYGIKAA